MDGRKNDLLERTTKFAEMLIDILRNIKRNALNERIISQLIGSSGSIGANYCEATESESRKDFIHKISVSKKEIKETQHWLRLISKTNPELDLKNIIQECHELLLIFSKIISTTKKNNLIISKK